MAYSNFTFLCKILGKTKGKIKGFRKGNKNFFKKSEESEKTLPIKLGKELKKKKNAINEINGVAIVLNITRVVIIALLLSFTYKLFGRLFFFF